MLEGYKKIYGFGDKVRESFWVKFIQPIILNQFHSLRPEYDNITKLLKELPDNLPKQKFRNIGIHYDFDLIKVFDTLNQIDVEEIFKKSNVFLGILQKMFVFLTLYIKEIDIIENKRGQGNEATIDNCLRIIHKLMDKIPNNKTKDSLAKTVDKIKNIKDLLK